jgi:hypothetical protein
LLGSNHEVIGVGIFNSETLEVGTEYIPLFPLTIKDLCRVFCDPVSVPEVNEDTSSWDAMVALMPEAPKMVQAVTEAIVKGDDGREEKIKKTREKVMLCTPAQLKENFQKVLKMSNAKDFFQCAALMQEAATMIASTKETGR